MPDAALRRYGLARCSVQDALGRYADGYLLGRFGFDVQPYGHVHGLKRRLRDSCFHRSNTTFSLGNRS